MNSFGFKQASTPLSILYWARKRLKKRCILVKPDPVSLMNRIAGEVELGQLREFVLVSRLIWVVDTMQWILDCEKGGCVYCNKYAQHGHLPRVMVSAKNSAVGKAITHEEDMIAERVLSHLEYNIEGAKEYDLVIPNSHIPNLVRSLQNRYGKMDGPRLCSEQDFLVRQQGHIESGRRPELQDIEERRGILAAVLTAGEREYAGLKQARVARTA